ncbi:hypothetical protein DAI22_12g096300 [Oryza sativa Japonica Group]|nr:uncharacterized protein LOC107277694 isoform X1 [Oryza sativa Japonica Group]KAF2907417.1 hypothetical protein DAI22_12g096300 [Oryza sativa Japonica Group]
MPCSLLALQSLDRYRSTCSVARITWFPKFANPPISWRTRMTSRNNGNGRIRLINTDFDIIFELFYGINHRRPRSVTVNTALTKLRARGVPLDIHFPRQFGKVCGRHASFKSEVTVCVRQEAPLKVKKWKNIEKAFHGTSSSIWTSLMGKFPEISLDDYECVMAQVERQYNIRRYNCTGPTAQQKCPQFMLHLKIGSG